MGTGEIITGASLVLDLAGMRAEVYTDPTTPGEKGSAGFGAEMNRAGVTLRRENGAAYTFPLDPVVGVNGKNVIVRRYVAKGALRGTVKESWGEDDYEITIAGVLIGRDGKELNEMVAELRKVCEAGEAIEIENDWLNDGHGITRVVVESFQMPHTKGVQNQAYTIRCYSDSSINILEEVQ